MRFTRAAKVAAFPLLALVLVVALIACTGPVGPPGKDATPVPGTPGTDAPPGLHATAVKTQVLNVGTEQTKTLDVSTAFAGGTSAGRTYGIVRADSVWTGLVYDLINNSELKLKAAENAVAASEDAVIMISATDADGKRAVAHVSVRANAEPVVVGDTALDVGTQAAESRKLAGAKVADYHSSTTIKCAMKNVCEVMVSAIDTNLRDSLTWTKYVTATPGDTVDANNKIVAVSADNSSDGRFDGVVKITGIEPGGATVRVWAVDEGSLPENIKDTDKNDDEDMSRPFPAMVHIIRVTVDGAPRMSHDAVENVKFTSLTGDAAKKVIGTVFNDESAEELILTTSSSTVNYKDVASVAWGEDVDVTNPAGTVTADTKGLPIVVTGHNSELTGAAITVKVTETVDPDNPDKPAQYVEQEFTVTVNLS